MGSERRGDRPDRRGGFERGPHLFDLDGVLTNSARAHAHAWKQLFDQAFASSVADRLGVVDRRPFALPSDYVDHVDGRPRRDGVVELLVGRGGDGARLAAGAELGAVVDELAARKDALFHAEVATGRVAVYDDAPPFLEWLAAAGVPRAVVSSSRNAHLVLGSTGLDRLVDAVVDGATLAERHLAGKPAPDSFLCGAELVGAPPERCTVVEDAVVGVQAGRAGGFGRVVGMDRSGRARAGPLLAAGADLVVHALTELRPS